jgi:hypothetical protein
MACGSRRLRERNSASGFTRKVSINEQGRRDNNLLKIHHYVLSVVGYLEAGVQILALRPATDQAFAILIEMSFGRLSYCWQHLRNVFSIMLLLRNVGKLPRRVPFRYLSGFSISQSIPASALVFLRLPREGLQMSG